MGKRICLIAPSLQMGGIERAMSTLANSFAKKGHEVHLVTIFSLEPFFELNKEVKLYVPPYQFQRTGRSTLQTLTYYYRVLSPMGGYVAQTVKKINPDVVMSFGDWLPHLAMLGLRRRYPFFYANRSNPLIKYSIPIEFTRWLAYKLTPPTGIIAQTTLAKERKVKILGNRIPIKIIPNPAREVTRYDVERENQIISVGRLHLEKGFVRLLEVFSKLNAPDWNLILVGGGVHEQQIKAKAEELGIADRVVFTGKAKSVDELLAKAKIYAMCSHKEGFPNALCEGMAAGLAPVSFNIVAGPSDIIDNGVNGYLVDENDLDAMRDRLQDLIDSPLEIERLGGEAAKVVDKFSMDRVTDSYLDFILGDYE